MKYLVYGTVTGSIYLGEYEADDAEAAKQMAEEEAWVCFCHQCASKCEDPQVTAIDAYPEDEA